MHHTFIVNAFGKSEEVEAQIQPVQLDEPHAPARALAQGRENHCVSQSTTRPF